MMISAAAGRSPLLALAVSAGAVLVFIFGFTAWQSPSRIPFAGGRASHYETYVHPVARRTRQEPPDCIGAALSLLR